MENKKEPLMSAETLLKETIENYNEKVSYVYQFAFNKSEEELFVNMMKAYAKYVLNNAKEFVADEAETKWDDGADFSGIYVDKQSIHTAIDNYIEINLNK